MPRLLSVNDIMNRVVAEIGLNQTNDPTSSTDETFILAKTLLNSAGQELLELHPWQSLVARYEINTLGTDNGAYDLPDDFSYMIDQTGWDRTNKMPINGPLSAQDWTYVEGRDLVAQTIYASFRQAQNQVVVFPNPPPDGLRLTFEYISRNWLAEAQVTDNRHDVIKDGGDLCLYEPILIIKFLKVKFLDAKGFDSTAARQDFENIFLSRSGKDEGAQILNASSSMRGVPYINPFHNTPDSGYGTY